MRLEVNGTKREIHSGELTPLLTVLRDELHLVGTKIGCEQGGCGTCTVLVDGQARRSCLTAIGALKDGTEVTTIEGIGTPASLTAVQQAFVHHYASQCGFCTPGMVVAATEYLVNGGTSDRDAIREALSGHLCRCTGYVKIIDAVAAAADGTEFDLSITAEGRNTTVIPGGVL